MSNCIYNTLFCIIDFLNYYINSNIFGLMKDNIIYHSHLGVYGLILKPKSIVLVKKSRGPYKGLFDLPGGSLEIAETLEEALVREIREETGCLVKQYDQIQTVTSLYHYNEDNVNKCLKHIAVLYKIEIIGEIKRESDGKDSDGCIWQSIDTINYKKISPIVHIASKFIK